MSPLTYAELTARLFPRLTGGIRWGLERTQRLLAGVGNPQRAFRVLHVGGTNGKGSVAAHLESVLRADGRHTGLYTSPHLCTFRERIRIGGRTIGHDALLAAAERLWPAIHDEGATFFEATTVIAFLALAEAGIEDAVIEVGLGGRLDSTNVVEPDVAIITNVSFDHVQILGPTVQHLAREKAGIIKPGVPVVTGESAGAAADIFRDAARAAGAPLTVLRPDEPAAVRTGRGGTTFRTYEPRWGELELHTPLIGAHQATNAALAVRALAALGDRAPGSDAVRAGLAATRWPARIQIEQVAGVDWVFDVAHNVAGVHALAAALRNLELRQPVVTLVGVLGDKDWTGMMQPICELADDVILTMPPTAPPERRWDPYAVLRDIDCGHARVIAGFRTALDSAYRAARHGTILVTGSFHTVGDAMTALRLDPDGSDAQIESPGFLPPSGQAG